jgi:hypothetical protein
MKTKSRFNKKGPIIQDQAGQTKTNNGTSFHSLQI